MEDSFRFKQFSVRHRDSALKVGTDAVILGAALTLNGEEKEALDIGTGSGVIALMVAQRAPGCVISAIDIDKASAEEAGFNFAASPWAGRLHAQHCALSEFGTEKRFDLIFSNPPYYDDSLKNPDEREAAARHTDSLSFAEIFDFSSEHLTADGRLSLILPAETLNSIKRIAASFGLFPFRILEVQTVERKRPKRIVIEFSRKKSSPSQEKLILQRGNQRSSEYQSLCSEFYLG